MRTSNSGNGGVDRSRMEPGCDERAEAIYKALVGDEYYEIVRDAGRIEELLFHSDARYRLLSLHFYPRVVAPTARAQERVAQMAQGDPDEFVRCSAIAAMSAASLRAVLERRPSIPPGGVGHFLKLFARMALDEREPERVRKAAYQGAVLCQPDFRKTKHIKTYLVSRVTVPEFDVGYLRTLLQEEGGRQWPCTFAGDK